MILLRVACFTCLVTCSSTTIWVSRWKRPSFAPNDMAFRNYTFASLTASGVLECASHCYTDHRCYSFNIGPSWTINNCELNDRLTDPHGSWLVLAPGFKYYEMMHRRNGEPSRLKPLQPGECVRASVYHASHFNALFIGDRAFLDSVGHAQISDPYPLEMYFRGFKGQVDAAFRLETPDLDIWIFLLQNGIVYKYSGNEFNALSLDPGFPKTMNEVFAGQIPEHPTIMISDGAMWDKIHFVSNGTAYMFNITTNQILDSRPREDSMFANLSHGITGGCRYFYIPEYQQCYPNVFYECNPALTYLHCTPFGSVLPIP